MLVLLVNERGMEQSRDCNGTGIDLVILVLFRRPNGNRNQFETTRLAFLR